MSLANFSDNFVSHVFVQLVDLKHLEFFSTDRPTDRQTDKPTYRSSFPELKNPMAPWLVGTIMIWCMASEAVKTLLTDPYAIKVQNQVIMTVKLL